MKKPPRGPRSWKPDLPKLKLLAFNGIYAEDIAIIMDRTLASILSCCGHYDIKVKRTPKTKEQADRPEKPRAPIKGEMCHRDGRRVNYGGGV